MNQHGGTADRCRLLAARLQAAVRDRRARERDERGSMLVEALVGMAMITIVVSGFLGVTNGVQASMRHHESVDAVDQLVTGLSEEASALPWAAVAQCGSGASDLATTVKYANTTADPCPPGAIAPSQTIALDGFNVTVTTAVTWQTPSPGSPDGYGRKLVNIVAKWTPPGESQARTVNEHYTRTSSPSEALPTSIPKVS